MKQFLFKISYFFFKKIKFTGKGYRIKKSFKKSFKFFFGYSHNVYIVYGGLVIKKISKYKILLLSNNKKKINKINKIIINIKKINIYTKRGLRGMQQLIFKRSGKKSTY
jgi:ribosomal protein L6P/L9E